MTTFTAFEDWKQEDGSILPVAVCTFESQTDAEWDLGTDMQANCSRGYGDDIVAAYIKDDQGNKVFEYDLTPTEPVVAEMLEEQVEMECTACCKRYIVSRNCDAVTCPHCGFTEAVEIPF